MSEKFNTYERPESPANLCSLHGWKAGDRLLSEKDGSCLCSMEIEITAIGRDSVLGVMIRKDDITIPDFYVNKERVWDLRCREWEKVKPVDE